MIPQFGTLVLIRNIFGTQKWKTLFTAILQGSTIFVQTLKLWENCLIQVSHEARRQSTAGQAKYMALKCLLDKRNHLTFFLKNTREDVFILSAHMTSPICKWMLNMEKNSRKTPSSTSHENWQNLFRFRQKFLKNGSLLV